MSKPGNRGKEFAQEICYSLALLRRKNENQLWDHGFDNVGHFLGPKRPADRIVLFQGTGWLLELKEERGLSIDFNRIEQHQRTALLRAMCSGNQGVILVKHVTRPVSRAFAFRIDQWMHLELASLRKSVPLVDGKRPDCCIEIPRYTIGDGNVRWDLMAMFNMFRQTKAS